MRRWVLGLSAMAVVAAGVMLALAARSRDPGAVAEAYIQGMARQDAEQVADTLCDAPQGSARLFSVYNTTLSAIQVTEIMRAGDRAEVRVSARSGSGAESAPLDWTLYLKRAGGEWCVSEMVNRAVLGGD